MSEHRDTRQTAWVAVILRAALAGGSSTAPNQASLPTTRERTPAEFSPIPAVKTTASSPPSAEASMPV